MTVPSFQLMDTEVTEAHDAAIDPNPDVFSSCGGDCPVDGWTWPRATDFCEAIGGRLPSESEWEYAARAGTTTRYYCGDEESCLDGIAWYLDNSDSGIHPVAMKAANAFGIYDMLGNIPEWVGDCWNDTYNGAPLNGDVWLSGECVLRVYRGSSFQYDSSRQRVSARLFDNPDTSTRNAGGFRCARDL